MGQGANQVLVGHDATAYSWTPGGLDDGVFRASTSNNLLGVWKSIEVEIEQTWEEVTPSAQYLKEKRNINGDWRATLEHQIRRNNNAPGLAAVLANDYLYVTFIESSSGAAVELWGGIARDRMKRDRGEGTDTLELENVGDIVGQGYSLAYDGSPYLAPTF